MHSTYQRKRRKYRVVWMDEDGDKCVDWFARYEQAVTWFKVLQSRVMCGDRLTDIRLISPRR